MTLSLPGMPEPEPVVELVPEQRVWREGELLELLRQRYTVQSQGVGSRYVFATHVRDDAGFDRRTADAVVLDAWQSSRHPLHGFEVKCSRSDWLRELKDPDKHTAVARYCHTWWLVIADRSMVKAGELPGGWGMLVPNGSHMLRAVVQPRAQQPDEPPRGFWVAFSRAAVKTETRRRA